MTTNYTITKTELVTIPSFVDLAYRIIAAVATAATPQIAAHFAATVFTFIDNGYGTVTYKDIVDIASECDIVVLCDDPRTHDLYYNF